MVAGAGGEDASAFISIVRIKNRIQFALLFVGADVDLLREPLMSLSTSQLKDA